jgi:hypothetical protein
MSTDHIQTPGPGRTALPPGDLEHYDGRWVAIRAGKVVAHGEDEPAVRAHAAFRPGDLVFPIGEPPSGFYLLNV